MTKLTRTQKETIATTYLKYPQLTQTMIAELFDVTPATISKAVRTYITEELGSHVYPRIHARGHINQFEHNIES
jgi:predicted XRE-type DNA-binding protein